MTGRARRQQRKRSRRFGKRTNFKKFYGWFVKRLMRELKHKLRVVPSKRQQREFTIGDQIMRQYRAALDREVDKVIEMAMVIRGS